jgi:hypothetical protein
MAELLARDVRRGSRMLIVELGPREIGSKSGRLGLRFALDGGLSSRGARFAGDVRAGTFLGCA